MQKIADDHAAGMTIPDLCLKYHEQKYRVYKAIRHIKGRKRYARKVALQENVAKEKLREATTGDGIRPPTKERLMARR